MLQTLSIGKMRLEGGKMGKKAGNYECTRRMGEESRKRGGDKQQKEVNSKYQ